MRRILSKVAFHACVWVVEEVLGIDLDLFSEPDPSCSPGGEA